MGRPSAPKRLKFGSTSSALLVANAGPDQSVKTTNPGGESTGVLTFDGSKSVGAVAWDWDFGDGKTASGQVVTHGYSSWGRRDYFGNPIYGAPAVGIYTVTLTATDTLGNKANDTMRVTVDWLKTPKAFTQSTVPALIVPINFSNNSSVQPWTYDRLNSYFFGPSGGLNAYYREISYGKHGLTGIVTDYVTVSMTTAQITAATYWQAVDQAKQILIQRGINISGYKHAYFVMAGVANLMPQFNGYSFVQNQAVSEIQPQTPDNMRLETIFVSLPSLTGGDYIQFHENGHQYGQWSGILSHSNMVDGILSGVGSDIVSLKSGAIPSLREYEDRYCMMGYGWDVHSPCAPQKESIGNWFDETTSPGILRPISSGTYHLEPLNGPGTGIKALKIPRNLVHPTQNRQEFYWIECRRATGIDSVLASAKYAQVLQGVQIRWGAVGGPHCYGTQTNVGFAGPLLLPMAGGEYATALPVGSSYVDAEAGITIRLLACSDAGADVQVTLTGPAISGVRGIPQTSANPASAPTIPPGASTTIKLAVTNNDSLGCPPARFSLVLNMSKASGVTATMSASQVTLGPGQTGLVAVNLTTTATAPKGYKNIGVGVYNLDAPFSFSLVNFMYLNVA